MPVFHEKSRQVKRFLRNFNLSKEKQAETTKKKNIYLV